MSNREYVVSQIERLPDSALEKVRDFISYRMFSLGLFDSDDEYLSAIPGMTDSIKEGLATPVSECVPIANEKASRFCTI